MTLINDRIEDVKDALLVAIKNELTETYPSLFSDYKNTQGDIRTKIFWADTIRFKPKYPCCMLTPSRDTSEGRDEIYYIKNSQNITTKRTVVRSYMNVTIDVIDMGDESIGKTSLLADKFAHKVARQLRTYFNGDGKLDWFSGNEYYERQIGITVQTDITPILDWSDTDTEFRYSFDIRLGWDDFSDTKAELAEGINLNLYQDKIKIDEINVNKIKGE